MSVGYEEFRREYVAGGLTRDMLDACPIKQFEHWLEQPQVIKKHFKHYQTGEAIPDELVQKMFPNFSESHIYEVMQWGSEPS